MEWNGKVYFTVPEAAKHKGVSRAAVYKAISENRLPALRVLNRLLVEPPDVEAWTPDGWGGQRAGQGRPPKTG